VIADCDEVPVGRFDALKRNEWSTLRLLTAAGRRDDASQDDHADS
jgi:hypothetical protein